MERVFRIPTAKTSGKVVLLIIVTLLLALAAWFATRLPEEVLGPAISLAVVLPVASLFGWLLLVQGRMTVVLTQEHLSLNIPWYGRRIMWAEVRKEEVRILGPDEKDEWRLKWRTNGIGLPGFQAGWFSSQGTQRVLAALTEGDIVVIPTTKRFSILVSVYDPDGLVEDIRGLSD